MVAVHVTLITDKYTKCNFIEVTAENIW